MEIPNTSPFFGALFHLRKCKLTILVSICIFCNFTILHTKIFQFSKDFIVTFVNIYCHVQHLGKVKLNNGIGRRIREVSILGKTIYVKPVITKLTIQTGNTFIYTVIEQQCIMYVYKKFCD